MRALPVVAVALVLVLVLFVATAGASSPIGLVKVTEGMATVQRGDEMLPARLGLALQEGDVLRTGADGRMGVVLRDDTRLSLGPESEIRIDRFLFAPAKGHLALVVKMARGVMAFVSGNIAKLSHDAVRVETPCRNCRSPGNTVPGQSGNTVEQSRCSLGNDGTRDAADRRRGCAVSCCSPRARRGAAPFPSRACSS